MAVATGAFCIAICMVLPFTFSRIILVKRSAVIKADKAMPSQVALVQLTDGDAYEALHAIVAHTVSPALKSFIQATGRSGRCVFSS